MRKMPCYKLFDVFASKARSEILKALWKKPLPVKEISKRTGLEQSNVSHQLKLMSRCSIVKVESIGREKIYSIESSAKPIITACRKHIQRHCKHRCREKRKKPKAG